MIGFDDKGLKKFNQRLQIASKRAMPFAVKSAIDGLAFEARREWQNEIDEKFVQRNKFTRSSIRVEKSSGLDVEKMNSKVGSIAKYMDEQELGGIKKAKGKHGVVIATSYSSGEGENATVRRKLPRAMNTMKRIQLKNRKAGALSRVQRNVIAVNQAIKNNDKYVFIDTGRKKFIARVVKKGRKGASIKMVHDMTKKTVKIKKNPTMKPAVARAERKLPQLYKKSLQFQLKRLGLSVK
jgi:hypothetical protein